MVQDFSPPGLEYLCTVDFHVAAGILALGTSPFGERRVGYVTGGTFRGPRLSGAVLPGGGNWPQQARLANGDAVGTFDARAIWQADDGALIYVTYTGRSVIPPDVRAAFADPAQPAVDPARYYLRIAPVFETSSPVHDWLNGVLAIGVGERITLGARHRIFAVC